MDENAVPITNVFSAKQTKPCLDTATADGNVNGQEWIRTTHPTAANKNSNPHATTSTHPAAETRKLVEDITRHSSTKETNYKQLTPLTNLRKKLLGARYLAERALVTGIGQLRLIP